MLVIAPTRKPNMPICRKAAGRKCVWKCNLWKISLTVDIISGHSSHVFSSPPAWHLSIISLVGMPGSCHHHHGNVSVLPVAITMAMGVSPRNHQHGPNVSLLTKITMAICDCRNTRLWYVFGCVGYLERGKKYHWPFYHLHWWWFLVIRFHCHCPSQLQCFTSHCISGWVLCCHLCPKLVMARSLNGTDGAAVHPILLLNTPGPSGSSLAPSAWDII